jgi:hypothetical protein
MSNRLFGYEPWKDDDNKPFTMVSYKRKANAPHWARSAATAAPIPGTKQDERSPIRTHTGSINLAGNLVTIATLKHIITAFSHCLADSSWA